MIDTALNQQNNIPRDLVSPVPTTLEIVSMIEAPATFIGCCIFVL